MPKTKKGNSGGRGLRGNRFGASASQPSHGRGRRIWVGELAQDAKEDDLYEEFEKYGDVGRLKIINGAVRHVRVDFLEEASAVAYENAIRLFNEHWVMDQSPMRLPQNNELSGGPSSGLGPNKEVFSAGPGYYLDLQMAPVRIREACKHICLYASTGLHLKVPFLPFQGEQEIIGGVGPRFWVCKNPEYFVHITAAADEAPAAGEAADGGADDGEAH